MKFQEAIDALRRKVPMTDDEFAALEAEELEFAFTVADVAQVDLVADVLESLQSAVENGTTLEDFKTAVADKLANAWGAENPAAVETIFRTNVMSAYNSGRHEAAMAVQDERPYWQYHAILDGRTADICREMDGVCLPADHAWWRGHYPPNHHNCFPPGTMIATPDGEVAIENLLIGDLVLSHDGVFHAISHVLVSRYDGKLSAIRHGEKILQATPNHPVAAEDSWVRADSLNIKRNKVWVLKGAGLVSDDSPPQGDGQGLKPEIGGVLDRMVVPTTAVEFDGEFDGGESDIGVELIDRALRDMRKAEQRQSGGKCALVTASERAFDSIGACDERLVAALGSSEGDVGVSDLHSSGVSVHGEVSPRIVLADSSHDAGFIENLGDGSATAIEAPRDGDRRLPIEIQSDDFLLGQDELDRHRFMLSDICIDLKNYTGNVYNLEISSSRTYVAEGVLVHNCRCIAASLTETQAKREGVTSSPPRIDVPAGFGKPPSVSKWEPDPGKYPPALGAELEDKLAADG